jgi:hypothetical protein
MSQKHLNTLKPGRFFRKLRASREADKKGPAFAGPALEATEGIVIWEGNYTPDILLSELYPVNFNIFSKRAAPV